MCKVEMLRALLNQRLNAAVDEIFVVFERTIAEYEEELCRTKEENARQLQLLDAFNRAGASCTKDVSEELPPNQQEWSSRVEQEEPKPPHLKEEEMWKSQEGKQRQGLDLPMICVIVKSEDDEDKGQSNENRGAGPRTSSSSQHMTAKGDGDHCRGSQADSLLAPLSDSDDKASHSADTDEEYSQATQATEDLSGIRSADVHDDHLPPEQQEWRSEVEPEEPEPPHMKAEEEMSEPPHVKEEGEHLLGLELPGSAVPVKSEDGEGSQIHSGQSEANRVAGPTSCNSTQHMSEDTQHMSEDVNVHTSSSHYPETFACSVFEGFFQNEYLMAENTRNNAFPCSVCGKRFSHKKNLTPDMRTHTGEKPFSCSFCGQSFSLKATLTTHMRRHTGEKPFACSVCGRRFSARGNWVTHRRTHTGEKPFSCSVCNKDFSARSAFASHMKRHTVTSI
ncbi:zinc finger protein 37 homolog isoform X2 [Phycodurus eques]|uniref:zinc finger protein 37 homolog isoform X2 n=1 Tax=Phycodurus eques TaxID=693459 RepID=UPI002ACDE820|nr:zinc finger protein 37 homolog isoform X2 [Phycodurus eques]